MQNCIGQSAICSILSAKSTTCYFTPSTHKIRPSSSKNSLAGGCRLSSINGITSSINPPDDSLAAYMESMFFFPFLDKEKETTHRYQLGG